MSVPRGPDVCADLQNWRAELEHDVLVVLQDERFRRCRVGLLIDGCLDRLAACDALAVDDGLTERLAPHREEVAEGERSVVASFDVDDPARVVCMQPADLRRSYPDEGGCG